MKKPPREMTLNVDGHEFRVHRLTIGEEIRHKGRRNSLCDGNYDRMVVSNLPDERNTAMFAHMVSELDAVIVDTDYPGWESCEALGSDNMDLLMALYKDYQERFIRPFRPEPGRIPGDSGNISEEEPPKEVVQG